MRATLARPVREMGLRGHGITPAARAEEAIMEAHARVDRAGSELVSSLHKLSMRLHEARSIQEVLRVIHDATGTYTEKMTDTKAYLREVACELSGAE